MVKAAVRCTRAIILETLLLIQKPVDIFALCAYNSLHAYELRN